MRVLRLLGVAAQAEGLRLRRTAGTTARRAAWLAAAGAFATMATVLVHAAVVVALTPQLGLAGALGVVALADLALAGLLAFLSRPIRDPVAEEALAVRRTMLAAAARNPLRGMAVGAEPGPMLGALAGEAITAWLRRR